MRALLVCILILSNYIAGAQGELFVEDTTGAPRYIYQDSLLPDPPGYIESLNPITWDLAFTIDSISPVYKEYRNRMIQQFEPHWAGYPDGHKQALIRNYIYPKETTTQELDQLYTEAERDSLQRVTMLNLSTPECNPRLSTTPSSKKYFDMRLDDSGTFNATEIKTDEQL